MEVFTAFSGQLTPVQRKKWDQIQQPADIQQLLDDIPYNGEDFNRTPLSVIRDNQCHCLDGGILGALALYKLGFPPLILDLVPQPGLDDDHVLAVFQVDGFWGCLAKSNYTGLRYRDPVYRTLRELVMSFFELFFNTDGVKTMRGYTRPLNLSRFDSALWSVNQPTLDRIVKFFYAKKSIPLFPSTQVEYIEDLDERSRKQAFFGVDLEQVYKPH